MSDKKYTSFSGDVGYRGVVMLDDVQLLATSGQVSINHDPIFSQGVWGAGYQNAAEQVAYANNYLRLEGSFGFQLTKGAGVSAVNKFAFTNRGNPAGTSIKILPNGQQGFEGIGWCSSLSFNASEGDVLNCDCNFSSYIDGSSNKIKTGSSSNSALGVSTDGLPFKANDLFPYWATQVYYGALGAEFSDTINTSKEKVINDITNWSASYNSQIVQLKCCRQDSKTASGYAYEDEDGAPLGPDYILVGTMTADGSYTVFKLAGQFEPANYHSGRSLRFVMNPSSDPIANNTGLYIPSAINSSGSTSIQTGASYITAQFSFTALGNGKNPPLSLYSSSSNEQGGEEGQGSEE